MCGIVSTYSWSGESSIDSLIAGLRTLIHRGPDSSAFWFSEDKCVALGHTRLAITDVLGGQQPIKNEEGSIISVVNGEFYDYESWLSKLTRKGHMFRTSSDSEILLHLYEEYGVECVEKLNGEFSFIIWDDRKKTLIAGRDRFGIKPLVWSKYKNQLFLASEAKALFAMGVPTVWDNQSFFQMSNMQYLPSNRTLFANVQQLPAGHLMIVNQDGLKEHCYWDMSLPLEHSNNVFSCREEAMIEITNALKKAVKRRLSSAVPMATQLSGGVDSSIVASLAAIEGQSKCFSITFDGVDKTYDEQDFTLQTASDLGLDLHMVSVTPDALASSLSNAVEKSEGIAINAHLPAKYLLSKAMHDDGIKVALTGEGADELFLGYPHLQTDYFSESISSTVSLKNNVSSGVMLPSGNEISTQQFQSLLGFVPCFIRAKATLGWKMRSLIKQDMSSAISQSDPFLFYLDSIDVIGQLKGRSQVNQSRYLWTKSALSGYILKTLGDGTEMAHSVEGRVPFLDHEVYDIAKKIPHSWLSEPMEKQILRDAVKGLVPDTVRLRKKHPFVAPPAFLSKAFIDLANDVFRSNSAKYHPYIDASAALKTLERLPFTQGAEQVGWDAALMMALTSVLVEDTFSMGNAL